MTSTRNKEYYLIFILKYISLKKRMIKLALKIENKSEKKY